MRTSSKANNLSSFRMSLAGFEAGFEAGSRLWKLQQNKKCKDEGEFSRQASTAEIGANAHECLCFEIGFN
jgi:hypothetical protein